MEIGRESISGGADEAILADAARSFLAASRAGVSG
jgi:hypothetical protein